MVKLLSSFIVVFLFLCTSMQKLAAQLDAFLELELEPATCRVGQQVRLEVKLYVFERDRDRLQAGGLAMAGLRERIRNQAFWEEKAARLSDTLYVEQRGQRAYYVQSLYRSFLFPLQAGTFAFDNIYLEAQRLELKPDPTPLDLLTGKDRRVVPLVLAPPPVSLKVLPLPAGISPGQVGTFEIQASLAPARVVTGSPVVLNIILSGTGNLALAPDPVFPIPEGFAAYAPLSGYEVEISDTALRGIKRLTVEMVPAFEGDYELGPVRYVYFDPDLERLDSVQATLPLLQVSGPDRPEVLESPLQGFYRKGMAQASSKAPFSLPYALAWGALLIFLAAGTLAYALWQLRKLP